MNDKVQLITALREELRRWEEQLSRLSEEEITALNRIADLSIKDILGHLTAWQQISVARMEAAAQSREPVYPDWLNGIDPESEPDIDQINRWIYQLYNGQPWVEVHREWQARFQTFLELCEAAPERELMETGRYPWLNEYPLSAVLVGSYEHHEEHLHELLVLLGQKKS